MLFLYLYVIGAVLTAFSASLYFGVRDGDWRNWDEPGRFFAPIGLGIMWPLTAVTFLPFLFGIMLDKRRDRLAAEAKEQKRIQEEERRLLAPGLAEIERDLKRK